MLATEEELGNHLGLLLHLSKMMVMMTIIYMYRGYLNGKKPNVPPTKHT